MARAYPFDGVHILEIESTVRDAGGMPVQRLNHAVLYVRDVERSSAFYRDLLGFRVKVEIPGRAVFLQAEGSTNDHDLGLFAIGDRAGDSEAGRRTVGLYHLAWEVDTLAELARVRDALAAAGALVGASDHATTKALYAQDPDGLEFEVSWLLPADLITEEVRASAMAIRPLDLEREIERYGARTRGGVGVSVPVAG
jgi:catechol-2,3-dioxygenase